MVAMVEVHLVGRKPLAAVRAWDATQVTQHLDHARLPDTDTLDFHRAISAVVIDIRGSLALPSVHEPV